MKSIIFSTDMVRAIIQGNKTMTRRLIKNLPDAGEVKVDLFSTFPEMEQALIDHLTQTNNGCNYNVGDIIYVKETYRLYNASKECTHYDEDALYCGCSRHHGKPVYRADSPCDDENKWKSPLFMPEHLSRIFLQINEIGCQRLQNISESDAIAEGIDRVGGEFSASPWRNYLKDVPGEMISHCSHPVRSFQTLWDSIYFGKPEKMWAKNPWVWIIRFNRVYDVGTLNNL